MSPKTDLFYGVFLGNEGSWHNDDDWTSLPDIEDNFDDLVAFDAGFVELGPTSFHEINDELRRAYRSAKHEAVKACPVQLVTGGSDASTDLSLAIRNTVVHADWDYNPLTLDVLMFQQDTAPLIAILREWAEKLELPWPMIEQANPDGPRWIIVTSEG
jgi:hypothetical protein